MYARACLKGDGGVMGGKERGALGGRRVLVASREGQTRDEHQNINTRPANLQSSFSTTSSTHQAYG